ncbi:chorismate mutase [Lederbergia galactosidilyticus]|nr:chorismate mutase [Lederbergia galactosidilytica]
MKRMAFEPPTDHYDEQIESIDEEICHLIKQRKDLSNNNPGFPTKHLIASWSKKYNFYEDFLDSIFSDFLHEEIYINQL